MHRKTITNFPRVYLTISRRNQQYKECTTASHDRFLAQQAKARTIERPIFWKGVVLVSHANWSPTLILKRVCHVSTAYIYADFLLCNLFPISQCSGTITEYDLYEEDKISLTATENETGT